MIGKYLVTAMLGTAIIGGAAFAQSAAPATSASSERAAGAAISAADNIKGSWRASKLVGLAVYNDGNERLGDISEILVDNSGKINAVILGVGGFLGVGEQNVAVNFNQLKWVNEPLRNATTSSNSPMTGGSASTSTTGPTGAPASTVGSSTQNNANANTTTSQNRDNWYPDHAVMSSTKDQLKALPAFKYSDYNK